MNKKTCRLKIIRANISENNIDTPKIIYVSQNKSINKKELYETIQKTYEESKNKIINNVEEIIIQKENENANMKLQDIIKSDREKENIENIENIEIKQDINNIEVENSIRKEEIENNKQNNLKSSDPYAIITKKKELDNSLRYIFIY